MVIHFDKMELFSTLEVSIMLFISWYKKSVTFKEFFRPKTKKKDGKGNRKL